MEAILFPSLLFLDFLNFPDCLSLFLSLICFLYDKFLLSKSLLLLSFNPLSAFFDIIDFFIPDTSELSLSSLWYFKFSGISCLLYSYLPFSLTSFTINFNFFCNSICLWFFISFFSSDSFFFCFIIFFGESFSLSKLLSLLFSSSESLFSILAYLFLPFLLPLCLFSSLDSSFIFLNIYNF